MKVGDQVFAPDHASFQGNEQVTGFGETSVVSVHDDSGVADSVIVDFASGWPEAADGVDVGTFAKHFSIEERCCGGGAGAEDIGFVGAGTGVDRFDFHSEFVFHLLGEMAGAGGIAAADERTLEVAHMTQNVEMSAGLTSGAEDAEDTGILASEQTRGDRAGRCGSHVGEVVRGNDEFGGTGVGVEEYVGCLKAIVGVTRIFAELDELHAESVVDTVVTGHDEKDPVGKFHLRPRGYESRVVARTKGFFDRRDEGARVEETMDFDFGQKVHGMTSETY